MKTADDGEERVAPPWSTRRILIFAGAMIATPALALLFGFFMVHVTETLTMVDSVVIGRTESPKLMTAFTVTGHGEDGAYMSGYRVKLIDVARNAAIDEQFIAREKDSIPPLPTIEHCNDENIWLVQKPEFIQGDIGFVARIAVINGKLTINNAPLPTGYVLVETRGPCQLKIKNKFNEPYCFSTDTSKLSEGECAPYATAAESYDKIKTAFILVNKTPESTRYHVYYYATDKPDPMKISVGSGGKQSLLYRLWFSHNRLSQGELEYYRKQLGPKDTLIPVYDQEYLIAPATLYRSPELAVYAEWDAQRGQRILCFSHTGKLLWAINEARYALGEKHREIKVKLYKEQILLSSNKWVIAVGKAQNAIQWSYFF